MSTSQKAIIITSYVEHPFDFSSQVRHEDYIICTDGGYDIAKDAGLSPDILIGDLDSIHAPIPTDIEILRFNPVKDYTDLQLALDHAVSYGAATCEVWGGIGGRLDQTVANLQLLEAYHAKFERLCLKDGANEAEILWPDGRENVVPYRAGWYFSLFALSDTCTNVTIRNAAYELTDAALSRTFPLGVSNEFSENKNSAVITYDHGTLLLVLSRK